MNSKFDSNPYISRFIYWENTGMLIQNKWDVLQYLFWLKMFIKVLAWHIVFIFCFKMCGVILMWPNNGLLKSQGMRTYGATLQWPPNINNRCKNREWERMAIIFICKSIFMMTSSNGNIFAILALCVGNSPVTGEFPSQRSVTRSFDVFFDLRLNKRLSKQ